MSATVRQSGVLPHAEERAIEAAAACALLDELETWPKPGLVSHVDAGSHTDMDARTFRASVAAIAPFYGELAQAGAAGSAMGELREIGLRAERAMMAATGGVNTHRGAIFALGLVSAAAGVAWVEKPNARPGPRSSAVCRIVQEFWGPAIRCDPIPPDTHGTNILRRFGAGGARDQAAGGFSHALNIGLPALRLGRELAPDDAEAARVQAFFALLATLTDTNVLYRTGESGAHYSREAAINFLAEGGVAQPDWRKRAALVHQDFIARRLSPGGSADLLAVTLFLDVLDSDS
jgi:triphosphoribosyl-dephospho-CoA synthase